MSLDVTVFHNDLPEETTIAHILMRCPPNVGDPLWFNGEERKRIVEEYGHSSWRIVTIAHWVRETRPPYPHEPIHTMAVFVRPTVESDS